MTNSKKNKKDYNLECKICGDKVSISMLREHLCQHNPNADKMDWEDIRDQFVLYNQVVLNEIQNKRKEFKMNYPFSLVFNDGNIFPELPCGEVLIYGKHYQTSAKCDYEGNMNIPPSRIKREEKERWVYLATDKDSIFAWHGERKKDGHYCFGKVNWAKALKKAERDAHRQQ